MNIIAYTFEADVHCPACTRKRFGYQGAVRQNMERLGRCDEQGVSLHVAPIDREGNEVRPVFSTDEHYFTHCGDCHSRLE